MTKLKRTLRMIDGLALIIGIMIGSGIFRTPGLVAGLLGRPGLTFVAWTLGGGVGLLGALIFAELATRHPQAGGKYVYAREAFGRSCAFTIGWIEALATYCVAIAAIAVVSGEYLARLLHADPAGARLIGVGCIAFLTALNLLGVATGRWFQNLATAAKVVALVGVVGVAFFSGSGAGWQGTLPGAPTGLALWSALAVAFQSVIWTSYGYPDAAKIAEEVRDPDRVLPRIFLIGIVGVTALYLLLNAAFLHVLPLDRMAASTLVAGDAATMIFGPRAGSAVTALALLAVVASLNGNLFVTPRVLFGLARDGLGPRALVRVNAGGTPWPAMLLIGVVSAALAATGTFESLLSLAVVFILLTDGFMVLVLFRLRSRVPHAAFTVPGYPIVPLIFLAIYALVLIGTALRQPAVTAAALGTLAAVYVLGRLITPPRL